MKNQFPFLYGKESNFLSIGSICVVLEILKYYCYFSFPKSSDFLKLNHQENEYKQCINEFSISWQVNEIKS